MNARRDLDAEFGPYAMGASLTLTSWKYGLVYVVADLDTAHVKIGRTTQDVRHRVRNLQTASPRELRLLFVMRGGAELERELHELFAAQRGRGEWFRLDGDLACFVTYCLAFLLIRRAA